MMDCGVNGVVYTLINRVMGLTKVFDLFLAFTSLN